MIDRAAVVAEARGWIGTRFHRQASVRGVGCDCIGLVVGVARAFGFVGADVFATPEFRGYGSVPDPAKLIEAADRYLDPVEQAQPGDVLVFRIEDEPAHFGLLATPTTMVHSYARARRVVEVTLAPFWSARLLRRYAFREAA